MAANKGFKVPMTVVTLNSRDKYPVVNTNDVSGGLHSVETISDMLSIPYLRRKLGMQCYVTSLEKTYKLISHTSADITIISDWEEIEKGISQVELANYAKTTDIPDVSEYVKRSEIGTPTTNPDGTPGSTIQLPDFSQFATKTEVQDVENKIPDVSEYVKRSEIGTPTTNPDGSPGNIELPDFSQFATKDELPDVSEYVKRSEIGTPTTNPDGSPGNIELPDFSQFATKTEVQVVDNKTETNKTNLANHIIYTQDELDKLQWQQKEFTVEANEVPKEVTIDIKNPNSQYKYPPVEVLKYSRLDTAIEETVRLADFNANEASNYETNDQVTFDGSLHIAPDVNINMSTPTLFTTGMYVSVSDPISYERIQNAASITIE
jgi:hypothetical protein